MKQFRVKRLVGVFPVTENGFLTVDLPRGYDLECAHLRLYGNINVTAAATSVRAEAPTQAIKRVEVVADGRNTVVSVPFWALTLAKYDRPMMEHLSRVVTPPTAAAIASYAIEANGVIDFATPDGERPKDSNFRTDQLSMLQMRLSFGAALDSFVPGAGAAAFVNCFVEVSVYEMIEVAAADGSRTTPILFKKMSFQEQTVTASNANLQLKLPAGNAIKSVLLRSEGLVTAGEPCTNMFNAMQLESGVDVRIKGSGAGIRGQNNADFGKGFDGYYILDVTRSGSRFARLSELWDVTQQQEPKAVLDVVGGANGKLQAVVTEYISLIK